MNGRRIVIVLFVAVLLVVVGFLLWRSRPSAEPAHPVSNQTAAPKAGAPAPALPPAPVDLGAVLSLDRLAECEQSPVLASILERMVRMDPRTFESRRGGPISVPGYARPITPSFERRRDTSQGADMREVTADLALPGRWHGLAVTAIRRYFHEESDVSSVEIHFAEPPLRVRDTLGRHGFRLPPVGDGREVNEGELETAVVIGVNRIDGGAALICAT